MLATRAQQPLVLFLSLVSYAALAPACSDGGGKRKLGQVCVDDDHCASGFCWQGVCVDPDGDEDVDSLANLFERDIGANPDDPDSDADGAPDRDELGSAASPIDTDGDGVPDIIESIIADADSDCIPDQLDAENDVYSADLAVMVPLACELRGVCLTGRSALVITCDAAGVARCAYDAVAGWEAEETTCDGLDNDCDDEVDEGADDLDGDTIADCVDGDVDGDGIPNEADVCPHDPDPDQGDGDLDGLGDLCDPPAAPALTASDPASPAAARELLVVGEADANAAVAIHADAECAVEIGRGDADSDGAFAVAVVLPDAIADGDVVFYGTAENGAALVSACARAAFVYRLDTTAPAAAIFSHSDPASPATDPSPLLHGSAEAGAGVTLSLRDDCADALAVFTADAAGAFYGEVALPPNSVTVVYAQVRDDAGNTSPCTALTTWEHDDVAPAPPTGVIAPAGPSNAAEPVIAISGCREPASDVLVYFADDCAGDPVAALALELEAGEPCESGEAYALSVAMPHNQATPVAVRARDRVGLTSPCAPLGMWIHDDLAPSEPVLVTLAPGPIGMTATVTLAVTADPATEVWLFADDPDCAGDPLAIATSDALGAVAFEATVTDNATTTLSALARDAADNRSDCVALAAYTHDDIDPPPAELTAILPGTIGPDLDVTLTGTAEAAAGVSVYTQPDCESGAFGTATAGAAGDWQLAGRVAPNTTTTFYATTRDVAGNTGACTQLALSYRHDDQAPAAASGFFLPASPSPDPTPDLVVCAVAGDTVALHPSAACDTTLAEPTVAASDETTPGIGDCPGDTGARFFDLAVTANSSTTVWATVTDAAGNPSACTALGAYRHDDQPPAPPTLTALSPGPAGNVLPTLTGEGEAGARLELYDAPACDAGGAPIAGADVDALGSWELSPTIPQGATTFYARVLDDAGNPSSCASLATYTFDSIAPAAPFFVAKTPALSPSSSPTLRIDGTVSNDELSKGTIVDVFLDRANCTSATPGDHASAVIGASAAWTVTLSLASTPNRTVQVHAHTVDIGGNPSACVLLTTHTHDDAPPAAPHMTSAQADALADQTSRSPTLTACAETGASVTLYENANCTTLHTTTTATTGTCPAGESALSATLDVAFGSTLDVYARATDPAGNLSTCAQLATYRHDGSPPDAPLLTTAVVSWNDAGGDDVTFEVDWVTGETDGEIQVFVGASASPCAGSPDDDAPVGAAPLQVRVAGNAEAYLSARIVDAAGNQGACSAVVHVVGEAFFDLANSTDGPLFDVPVAVHRPDGSLHQTTTTQDVGGRARASVWAFEGVMVTALETAGADPVRHTLLTAELEPGLVVYHRAPGFSFFNPNFRYLEVTTATLPEGAATLVATTGCGVGTYSADTEQPFTFSVGLSFCQTPSAQDLVVWVLSGDGEPLGYSLAEDVAPGSNPTPSVDMPDWKTDWATLSVTFDNDDTDAVDIGPVLKTHTAGEEGAGGVSDDAEVSLPAGTSLTRDLHYVPSLVDGYAITSVQGYGTPPKRTTGTTTIHRNGTPPPSLTYTLSRDFWNTTLELDAPFAGESRPSWKVPGDPLRVADVVLVDGLWTLNDPATVTTWTMLLRPRAAATTDTTFVFPELPVTAAWDHVAPAGFDLQESAEVVMYQVEAPGWESYRDVVELLQGSVFAYQPLVTHFSGDFTIRTIELVTSTDQ